MARTIRGWPITFLTTGRPVIRAWPKVGVDGLNMPAACNVQTGGRRHYKQTANLKKPEKGKPVEVKREYSSVRLYGSLHRFLLSHGHAMQPFSLALRVSPHNPPHVWCATLKVRRSRQPPRAPSPPHGKGAEVSAPPPLTPGSIWRNPAHEPGNCAGARPGKPAQPPARMATTGTAPYSQLLPPLPLSIGNIRAISADRTSHIGGNEKDKIWILLL